MVVEVWEDELVALVAPGSPPVPLLPPSAVLPPWPDEPPLPEEEALDVELSSPHAASARRREKTGVERIRFSVGARERPRTYTPRTMTIDAVALLRIPGFTPPEDADVRELEDGFLLFLGVEFENDPEAILDALDDALGDSLADHEDERGVFVLPDAAEPEDATTYDQVITAVGDKGIFLDPGAAGAPDMQAMLGRPEVQALIGGQEMQNMLGQMFQSLGVGSIEDIAKAMQSGDPDAMKMAQVQMMGALERAMAPGAEGAEGDEAEDGAADAAAGPKAPTANAKTEPKA